MHSAHHPEMVRAYLCFPPWSQLKVGLVVEKQLSLQQRPSLYAARISSLVIVMCGINLHIVCLKKESAYGHVNNVKYKVFLSGEVTSDSCPESPGTILKWKTQ